eukprot:c8017_g1_i1.p1 GENE.c8017_g1_i1~~c8017_g1_i1.p1  ORF type:complete len:113 (+),score=32.12 c8017_g1_i1:331-669(+)
MPGATNLHASNELKELLTKQNNDNKLIAAICAAPFVVLTQHNLINNRQITCHPNFASKLPEHNSTRVEERVVVDQNLITSRGPGTAIEFSLAIVEALLGSEKMSEIKKPLVC